MGAVVSLTPADVEFLTGLGGSLEPREGDRLPASLARQPAVHADREVFRDVDGGYRGDGDGGGLAGERDDVRQAVHDPGSVEGSDQTPPWDPDDTFDAYDNWGNPLADTDGCLHPGRPTTAEPTPGYNATRDKGIEVAVEGRATDNKIAPELLLLPGESRATSGGIRLPAGHRRLQHVDRAVRRRPGCRSPATWSGRPSQGMDDLDREGSERLLGHVQERGGAAR